MKFLTAYCFLLLYTTLLLKPVLPVISDGLSHFFAEAKHLATVHAHHGDHHLDHELAEAGEDHGHEEHQSSLKAEDLMQLHIFLPFSITDAGSITLSTTYSRLKLIKPALIFIAKHGPPPKFFL